MRCGLRGRRDLGAPVLDAGLAGGAARRPPARSPDSSSTARPRVAKASTTSRPRRGAAGRRRQSARGGRPGRANHSSERPSSTAHRRRRRSAPSRDGRRPAAGPGRRCSTTPSAGAHPGHGARQRLRQRMARVGGDGRGGLRERSRVDAAVDQLRPAEGQGAGLVEHDMVDASPSRSSAVGDSSSTPRAQQARAGDHLHDRAPPAPARRGR